MPFWYFGSKHALARHYPPPAFSPIIEPFAGAAGYSVYYAKMGQPVLLVDANPEVVALWHTLQSPDAIDYLDVCEKELYEGDGTITHPLVWGVGGDPFRVGGTATRTTRMMTDWPTQRRRIERVLPLIKDWTVRCDDYASIPNTRATWFIDPPYQTYFSRAGNRYTTKELDYTQLAAWCRARKGQVIVCEQNPASWLPFSALKNQNAYTGRTDRARRRTELVWTLTPGTSLGRAGATARETARKRRPRRSARWERP